MHIPYLPGDVPSEPPPLWPRMSVLRFASGGSEFLRQPGTFGKQCVFNGFDVDILDPCRRNQEG